MTDKAAEEVSSAVVEPTKSTGAPAPQQAAIEGPSVKQREGRRRNADETKEFTEGDEVHVVLIRDKDAKGRSREDASKVCFSKVQKASQLHLSEDRMTLTGQKGYR